MCNRQDGVISNQTAVEYKSSIQLWYFIVNSFSVVLLVMIACMCKLSELELWIYGFLMWRDMRADMAITQLIYAKM